MIKKNFESMLKLKITEFTNNLHAKITEMTFVNDCVCCFPLSLSRNKEKGVLLGFAMFIV